MLKAKNIVYILPVLVLAFALAGCIASEEPKPKADGKELYNYITKENSYQNWKLWPGKGKLYAGAEPHGALLTTYVTDNAFSAIEGKQGSMPYGSIIVKENYMPDKTLAAITVMYKVKGYDAEHNDWFWLKYSPDGKIDAEGKVDMCYGCHGAKKDNDYVFTSILK